MFHRQFLAAALSGTALLAALSGPATAGPKFEFVSQSVIVMKGIPSRRAKPVPVAVIEASTKPAGEPLAVDPQTGVPILSAEERRLLRYGLAEENKRKLAEAERKVVNESPAAAAAPADEKKEEPAEKTQAEARFDASNTTVKVVPIEEAAPKITNWETTAQQKPDKAALQAHARRQFEAEAPQPADRLVRKAQRKRGKDKPAQDTGRKGDPLAMDQKSG